MLTDIEIARSIEKRNIADIAKEYKIDVNDLEMYGKYKAKLSEEYLRSHTDLKKGKLVLVTAINPTSAPVDRIFLDFFEKRQHLFVVVDEYGSVTGVISMEDILEEILGREIVDESDTARNMQDLARRWKNTRWKK